MASYANIPSEPRRISGKDRPLPSKLLPLEVIDPLLDDAGSTMLSLETRTRESPKGDIPHFTFCKLTPGELTTSK
jgi:hypothetical protein